MCQITHIDRQHEQLPFCSSLNMIVLILILFLILLCFDIVHCIWVLEAGVLPGEQEVCFQAARRFPILPSRRRLTPLLSAHFATDLSQYN